MNRPDQALATVLKRFRLQHGVTQEALAFQANLTIATMSRTERGINNPTWTSVQAIARALKIKLDELGAAVETEQHQAIEKANGYSEEGTSPQLDHSPAPRLPLAPQ
jgi:transcriptional regulator with XRE-family HTH domain